MVKALIFITLLLVLFLSSFHFIQNGESHDQYEEWKAEYRVHISPSEDVYRKFVFMRNL